MPSGELRKIKQELQQLRTTWDIRKNKILQMQYNKTSANTTRAQSGNEYTNKNLFKKTKGLRDSNGKVYIGAQKKLRLSTEYIQEDFPRWQQPK